MKDHELTEFQIMWCIFVAALIVVALDFLVWRPN